MPAFCNTASKLQAAFGDTFSDRKLSASSFRGCFGGGGCSDGRRFFGWLVALAALAQEGDRKPDEIFGGVTGALGFAALAFTAAAGLAGGIRGLAAGGGGGLALPVPLGVGGLDPLG
eukprot:827137-Alexandrium_andersonii.AAC.1